MSDAIVVEGLVKRFRALLPWRGARTVVDGLDLRVPAGGVTGLLGPNGAGKSTVTRVLLGLARANAGRATVLGRDAWRDSLAVRRDVAYVPAERAVLDWMRAGELIAGVRALSPRWDEACARRLAAEWEVDEGARLRTLSTGARSRLFLLVALARRTSLLILDEPTAGLDPAAVESALGELAGASADGATILLVTHRLDEVDRLCDRVTVMERGRAALTSDLDALRQGWRAIDVVGHPRPELMARWEEVARLTTHGEVSRLLVREAPAAVSDRVRMLGARVVGERPLGLREVYLAVTGQEETADAASDDPA